MFSFRLLASTALCLVTLFPAAYASEAGFTLSAEAGLPEAKIALEEEVLFEMSSLVMGSPFGSLSFDLRLGKYDVDFADLFGMVSGTSVGSDNVVRTVTCSIRAKLEVDIFRMRSPNVIVLNSIRNSEQLLLTRTINCTVSPNAPVVAPEETIELKNLDPVEALDEAFFKLEDAILAKVAGQAPAARIQSSSFSLSQGKFRPEDFSDVSGTAKGVLRFEDASTKQYSCDIGGRIKVEPTTKSGPEEGAVTLGIPSVDSTILRSEIECTIE